MCIGLVWYSGTGPDLSLELRPPAWKCTWAAQAVARHQHTWTHTYLQRLSFPQESMIKIKFIILLDHTVGQVRHKDLDDKASNFIL